MADDFGPHAERRGGRLGQIQRLGRPGLGRLYVEESGARASGACAETSEARPIPTSASTTPEAPAMGARRGRGRPKFEGVRPWEAAGISRAEYFRRKKGGGGG
jgi:hypothetical protein